MNWEKTFLKKSNKKTEKKQKINVKMPHVNKKPLARNWNLIQTKKLGLEWAVNGLGKPFRKKPIQKIEKTVKIRVKFPHVNKRPLPINRIFVQTPFSHSTLKLDRKKFTPQNHSLFRSNSCFRRDQNHFSNLTSKIMKMCEQIFKKKTAPQYNSNSLNCKKN